MNKVKKLFLAVVSFLFTVIVLSIDTYAYSPGQNVIVDKVVSANFARCYGYLKDGGIRADDDDGLQYHGGGGEYDAIYYLSKESTVEGMLFDKDVYLPNQMFSSNVFDENGTAISCASFLFGFDFWPRRILPDQNPNGANWSGVLNSPSIQSSQDSHNYLQYLGYVPEESSVEKVCFRYNLPTDEGSGGYLTSNKICFDKVDSGNLDFGSMIITNHQDGERLYINFHDNGLNIFSVFYGSDEDGQSLINRQYIGCGEDEYENPQPNCSINSVGEKMGETIAELRGTFNTYSMDIGEGFSIVDRSGGDLGIVIDSGDDDSVLKNQTYGKDANSLSTAMNNAHVTPISDLGLITNVELYNLYVSYLSNGDKVQIACLNEGETLNESGWIGIDKIKVDGEKKTGCYARPKSGYTEYYSMSRMPFSVGGTDNVHSLNISGDLNYLVTQMNSFDLDRYFNEVDSVSPNATPSEEGWSGEEEEPSEVEKNCQTEGGASSLGWILCPLLTWMGNATEDVYSNAIVPILRIDARLFSFNEDSGTRKGWETFRNIANVAFIIFFVVVIFSQLTGYGIDNYGIKKILPKMIVTVLLVNLSFLICSLLVDLSNIAGAGLQSVFNGLSDGLGEVSISIENTDNNSGSSSLGAAGTTAITGVAIASVLVMMVGAIWQNPAVLLSLLIAIIGVAVSILFLFLLLSVRSALVIVLTVVSPVAIVCYMLPNAKKVFDRWWKLFEGMLLLFPICGLLVGGGDYASRLLIKSGTLSNGFFPALTAMLVGIVPIFFIPSVLKSSFNAMGKVGGMLSGLGSRMGRGASNRLRNTERVKNAQRRGAERRSRLRTRYRAGVDRKGNAKNLNRFQRVMRGGKRNVAENRSQYLSDIEKRRREDNLIGSKDDFNFGFNAAIASAEGRVEDQNVANAQALLANGRVKNNEGERVNVNDASSLGKFHKEALARYSNAKNDNERTRAMSDIKAAQNFLSKTDAGRSQVQNNLEDAIAIGQTSGLSGAAAHLMSNYGDLYQSKNRGANTLISELATSRLGADGEIPSGVVSGFQSKLANSFYDTSGASKYTQESLANADTQALKRMSNAVATGAMSGDNLNRIMNTAKGALSMYKSGKLNAQPGAVEYLRKIASGPSSSNSTSDGAELSLTHSAGNSSVGWDSRLSSEQISEMKADGITPGSSEYDSALTNYGIKPNIQRTTSEMPSTNVASVSNKVGLKK